MAVLGYLASVLMGLSLGLMGGGGSILTVPILVYLFGLSPIVATGDSLFIVGLTALVGGIFYFRRGEVDLKTGALFALPGFLGVFLARSWLVPSLPDPILSVGTVVITKPLFIMAAFAVLMMTASLSMIRGRKEVSARPQMSSGKKLTLILGQGFFVGVVAGFVGAGGGFLIIPALVILVGLPMKMAVGTSLFIIATNSLIGFLGDLQRQRETDWRLMLTIAAIAIVGLFLGMGLSSKVSEKALKKGFGYFVLMMGIFVLFDQIKKLS